MNLFCSIFLMMEVVMAGNQVPSFGSDVEFMKKHVEVIVLSQSGGQAQVAVVPAYQGRVMTSTAGGADGMSFGWINREIITKGEPQPHITVVGGEDRIWFGPEGGQFSIYFKKDSPFEMEYWHVPAVIDSLAWDVTKKSRTSVTFKKDISLVNYSGNKLDFKAERTVRLLKKSEISEKISVQVPGSVKAVAFETVNSIKNTGDQAWTRETGMISIWILGMLQASPKTTVVVPFNTGCETELGQIVNDEYFGKVPKERLKVDEQKGMLYFKGDAKYRSKIGLTQKRAKPVLGSYDAANGLLTIVQYTLPEKPAGYVNSMWELQEDPFSGDAINSYNDGPNDLGASLGNFYELESSSPAAGLAPGQSIKHVHRTIHLQGSKEELDRIARAVLGVGVDEISRALNN